MLNFNPCILIPCYNHGRSLETTIKSLRYLALPFFVVDDGSDEKNRRLIDQACKGKADVSLIRLDKNSGKGTAVIRGAEEVLKKGYTHFLQIDADGQHNPKDAEKIIAAGKETPSALISGQPIFDESIPKSRKFCRYLTHFWVYVETMSFDIKDSFCGFRLYPAGTFCELVQKQHIGAYMDFDIEVIVRFYWLGKPVLFVPTKVIYPEDGISHFNLFKDNWRITKMHTRLFFESLPRLPGLLFRRRERHWARIRERKGLYGLYFLVGTYRAFGRTAFRLFMMPPVFYFWLTGATQRKASKDFLRRVADIQEAQTGKRPEFSSYRHFLNFSECVLDKIACWSENWDEGKQFVLSDELSRELLTKRPNQRGKLLLVSHLGMAEVSRALAFKQPGFVINALVYDKNAERIRSMMNSSSKNSGLNLMLVDQIDLATSITLEEKISQGEWVAIAADRVPVSWDSKEVVDETFFGEKANFPIGPFVLASLLRCEVNTLFAVRVNDKFVIEARPFAEQVKLDRRNRAESARPYVRKYAGMLEEKALAYPLNWFNFFDFWNSNR